MDSSSTFENSNNSIETPESFKKIRRNNQMKPNKNKDLEISEIKLDDKFIKISRDIKKINNEEGIIKPNLLNRKSPVWYDEMINTEKIHKNQEIQTDDDHLNMSFNDISLRKNQEMQTNNEKLNKSFNDYIRSDSKGIQVEESGKLTLDEMRFDIFKRNIHLNEKTPNIQKEIEEYEKRLEKNKTFWDYLNYNNRTHVIAKNKSPRLSPNNENEFNKYIDRKDSAKNNFIWQIDEFKK